MSETIERYKTKILRLLTPGIPRRFKRLIFVASFWACIKNTKHPDTKTLDKINRILNLAHHEEAIAFPMYIQNWIWSRHQKDPYIRLSERTIRLSELLSTKLKETDYQDITRYAMRICPSWIVYGSEDMIRLDLEKVIRSIQQDTKMA